MAQCGQSMNITFHISHPSGRYVVLPSRRCRMKIHPTRECEVTAEHHLSCNHRARQIADDDRDIGDFARMEGTSFTFGHVSAVPK